MLNTTIELREVTDADFAVFFENQKDPEASRMAAFTAKDPEDRQAFENHMRRILADPTCTMKTIVAQGQVVGSVGSYQRKGETDVTYWIGRQFWGQGIATQALKAFLKDDPVRPIFASAARDNAASIRVLEKCGFKEIGRDKGFANARGEEIEEVLLRLD